MILHNCTRNETEKNHKDLLPLFVVVCGNSPVDPCIVARMTYIMHEPCATRTFKRIFMMLHSPVEMIMGLISQIALLCHSNVFLVAVVVVVIAMLLSTRSMYRIVFYIIIYDILYVCVVCILSAEFQQRRTTKLNSLFALGFLFVSLCKQKQSEEWSLLPIESGPLECNESVDRRNILRNYNNNNETKKKWKKYESGSKR